MVIPVSQEEKSVTGGVFAASTYYFETTPTDISQIAIEASQGISRNMIYHTIISNLEKYVSM